MIHLHHGTFFIIHMCVRVCTCMCVCVLFIDIGMNLQCPSDGIAGVHWYAWLKERYLVTAKNK